MWTTKRSAEQPADTSNGKRSFLAAAKDRHAEMIRTLLSRSEEFSSVETYTDAIEAQSWEFAQALARQSFVNGKQAGGSRRRAA